MINNDGASHPVLASLSDRLPPQNLAAEQGVLGAMLLDPETINDVIDLVQPEDFYRDSHQRIYRAILAIWERSGPLDLVILIEELTRTGNLRAAGGEEYLAEIVNVTPTAANAAYYAGIVKQKAIGRSLIDLANTILRDGYSDSFTAEQLIEKAEQGVLDIGQSTTRTGAVSLAEASAKALHEIAERKQGIRRGVLTGFFDLDGLLVSVKPQRLYVLAARPSIGKSALALNIAIHAARHLDKRVLFVSLEMDAVELASRYLSFQARINGHDLNYPSRLTEADWQTLRDVAGIDALSTHVTIDDPPHLTITQLAARARRHKLKHGLDLLVVDYLQLIDGQPRKGEIREQEVARISRRLKGLAKQLRIPVLALAQLNRAVEGREDRKPRVSDLRESGQIEADADVVMLLHEPEPPVSADVPSQIQIVVAKHRGGPKGTVELTFDKQQQRFGDTNSNY